MKGKSWGREIAVLAGFIPMILQMFGVNLTPEDQATFDQVKQHVAVSWTALIAAIGGAAALYSKISSMLRNKNKTPLSGQSGQSIMSSIYVLAAMIAIFFSFVGLFNGCKDWAWLSSYPSICSDQAKQAELHDWAKQKYGMQISWTDESSLLCEIADKAGIHLDYDSDLVFVGNLIAIKNNPSLRDKSIEIFANVRDFVLVNKDLLSGTNFSAYVFAQLAKYPELGLAAGPLMSYIKAAGLKVFKMKDIAMLLWYCDRNLIVLNSI